MPQSSNHSQTPPHIPLIDIHNIDLYRGGSLIFSNFSLRLPQGCRYAVLGPNGSGKTSLIMLLIRSLYPAYKQDSWIKILGESRWHVNKLQKRMGIISYELQKDYPDDATGKEVVLSGFFQSQGIYAHQTIRPEMEVETEKILSRLEIFHLKDKPFSTMSAGEERRCLLARAWVHDPECLVLDEPTYGMDLKSTWQYLNILRNWVNKDKGLVLVTHHLNEIIPEVDTVIMMKAGKIFCQGPKEEVLTQEKLSELYETPLKVFMREGYYFVMGLDPLTL